jgi:heme-degrading monooxygenase HmoA
MTGLVTTGTWRVRPAKEAEFVEAWAAFAGWASSMPGASALRLGRATDDPLRFVSFGVWDDASSAHGWKSSPLFGERMAQVLQHVEDFQPAELDIVASVDAGGSATT